MPVLQPLCEYGGVEVAAPGLRRQSMRAAPLRSASSSGVLDRLLGETHAVANHREPIINEAIEVVRWFLSDEDVLSAWPRIQKMDADEARERLFATAALASRLVDRLATASASDKVEWFQEFVSELLGKR